MTQISQIFCGG